MSSWLSTFKFAMRSIMVNSFDGAPLQNNAPVNLYLFWWEILWMTVKYNNGVMFIIYGYSIYGLLQL